MKNKDLIKQLQKLDPEKDVRSGYYRSDSWAIEGVEEMDDHIYISWSEDE